MRRPSQRTRARIEQYRKAIKAHEENDQVVRAARGSERIETLYLAREQVAIEAASLLWVRLNARPGSREFGRTCSRRVSALAEVASLTIAISKADPDAPTIETTKWVCALLLYELKAAAASVLPSEAAAALDMALQQRLDDSVLDRVISAR
ncbi:MAG TPA: hypothetical protein VGC79_26900 [Polyangiaceae bacterium]